MTAHDHINVWKRALRSLKSDARATTITPQMHYVYLLRSIDQPQQTHIGFTSGLKKRIKAHNAGQSIHTAKYRPWELTTYLAFSNESKAREFENYLKSHSGKAFASKRLWS